MIMSWDIAWITQKTAFSLFNDHGKWSWSISDVHYDNFQRVHHVVCWVKLKVIAVRKKRKMPVSQLVHGLTLTPKFLISNFIWKCLFRQIILCILLACTTIHDIQNGTESLDSMIKPRDPRTASAGGGSSRIRSQIFIGPGLLQLLESSKSTLKFFWFWARAVQDYQNFVGPRPVWDCQTFDAPRPVLKLLKLPRLRKFSGPSPSRSWTSQFFARSFCPV